MATVLSIDLIVSDSQIRDGKPVIAGTGIRVSDIAAYHESMSAQEIPQAFSLPLGQTYAALTYYFLHQDEIDEELRKNATEGEQLSKELAAKGLLTLHVNASC